MPKCISLRDVGILSEKRETKKGDNYFFQNDNSIRTYVGVST